MAPPEDLHERPQLAGGRASRWQIFVVVLGVLCLIGVALYGVNAWRTNHQTAQVRQPATTALPAVGHAQTEGSAPAGRIATPVPGNASPDTRPPHLPKG